MADTAARVGLRRREAAVGLKSSVEEVLAELHMGGTIFSAGRLGSKSLCTKHLGFEYNFLTLERQIWSS